jgi:hypothetical protein
MSIVFDTPVLSYTFSTQYSTSPVELNNLKIISIHGTSDKDFQCKECSNFCVIIIYIKCQFFI